MNVYMNNVGINKETEKAIQVVVYAQGFKFTKWLPKSQIEILSRGETHSFFYTYHNIKLHNGMIADGKAKKNFYKEKANILVNGWLYKKELKECI